MDQLKRNLGPISLSFYGTGMILGAGIYSIVGPAAGLAGNGLWIAFLLSAIIATLTAFSYAEISSIYPEAGAEYTYFQKAFPKLPSLGSLTGLLLIVVNAATAATVSLAFAGYLAAWLPWPREILAFGLIALATLVNVLGIEASSRVNILLTLLEVSGLLIVLGLGFQNLGTTPVWPILETQNIIPAAALVFFSFLGFENIVNLSEEAKRAERDIPIAIFVSLLVASLLYMLIGVSVIQLLPPPELAASSTPLSDAVRGQSPSLAQVLGFIALFSTANTALIGLLSGSRIAFAMGRSKDLPKGFGTVLAKQGTPLKASVLAAVLALGLLLLGEVKVVASLTSLISLLSFAGVHLAVLTLRSREPKLPRPFRIPGPQTRFPWIAALGLLATLGLLTQFEARIYAYTGGLLLLIVLIYFWQRRSNR